MSGTATCVIRLRVLLLGLLSLGVLCGPARAADPDVLWKIVSGGCVPHHQGGAGPAPCVAVDLGPGAGVAVLKDLVGVAQFLLIPTERVAGIESPEILRPDAPNYWAHAWKAREWAAARLRRPLPRDWVSLAINSRYGRSQNQLHIHVDCVRPDVRDILNRQAGAIGEQWVRLGVPLSGHDYWVRRVVGRDLGANDPFRLLADGLPGAREQMDRYTLVVVGASFADAGEGFILLADRADLLGVNIGYGEELQDHACAGLAE